MNKTQFVKAIAEKTGFTIKDADAFVNAYADVVKETLVAGDKIQVVGFGSYEVKDVAEKQGVNPATGEKITIAACKKPVLKFSSALKDELNK